MAHLIDNSKGYNAFVSFAAPAWHGLGTVLQQPLTVKDALTQGGLDYDVIKLPNIHRFYDSGEPVEIISQDSFFTLRTDVNQVLGSRLGRDYTVLQNRDALDIVDEILQTGTAAIETAGAIDGGKKVFVCLKLNNSIIVGSNDFINQYVLIATSHDGSLSITTIPTNVRVVCNNTLSAALKGKNKISVKHTQNAADRMREAMRIMKLLSSNFTENEDSYNLMAQRVISPSEMFDYFGNIFLTQDEINKFQDGKNAGDVLSTRKKNILNDVVNFANIGAGQKMAMIGNDYTMWSAYNAVTGYVTRKKYSSVNDRANSMLFGAASQTIELAGTLANHPSNIKPLRKRIDFANINFN